MAKLPVARVVRDKPWPATDILSPAPRRIPPTLWIRIAFGGLIAPAGWFALALIAWIFVFVVLSNNAQDTPNDGMPMSWGIAITACACAPVLVIAAWRARKQLHMLRHGRETRGKLLGKREVEGSDSSVWHYTFEYTIENGTTQVVTVITDVREELLEDDILEPMLYDPSGRREATTIDHLPGYPRIGEHGELVARDTRVWPVLLLPVIALAGVVAALATAP